MTAGTFSRRRATVLVVLVMLVVVLLVIDWSLALTGVTAAVIGEIFRVVVQAVRP